MLFRVCLCVGPTSIIVNNRPCVKIQSDVNNFHISEVHTICLYRDVWIAAIASSTTSLATQTAAICVRFQGRRARHAYVTMQVTFLTRKSALIYRRGLRQRVASLTLDCNGVFAIKAHSVNQLQIPWRYLTIIEPAIYLCITCVR